MDNNERTTLIWIDMEMTGLNPETCHIVQMAMVLTDVDLNELAEPLDLTIWQPDSVLETMSPFVREMHRSSGLLDAIRTSSITVADAERRTMEILTTHVPYRQGRLCGNSIGQDRRFIAQFMPCLDGYLHYRQVDVSSLKELAAWWYKEKYIKPTEGKHTALFDIRQSIEELKYYRDTVMKPARVKAASTKPPGR